MDDHTAASYTAIAAMYADRFGDELDRMPVERAVLRHFAEVVSGPVIDVGCGPGQVSALLRGLGCDVSGIDLAEGMVAQARRRYPAVSFEVGSMLDLPRPDRSVGGVLAWYSTIHVADVDLPRAMAEFERVLVPGGHLLVGFQIGDWVRHLSDAWGQAVSLDFHRRRPEDVAAVITAAGLDLRSRTIREPLPDEGVEPTAKAYLLARKPFSRDGS